MQSQFENKQSEKWWQGKNLEKLNTIRESFGKEKRMFESDLSGYPIMPTEICAAKERNVELPRIVLTKKATFPPVLGKPDWIPFEIIEE